MKKQDYKNHIQYYPPHHFIFYPAVIIFTAICIWQANKSSDQSLIWTGLAIILALIAWLSFMTRQHYALGNQNRIVRLELRLRYYQLTHQKFEPVESKLNFSQLAALRFASDGELVSLIQKTLDENLKADAIKKLIVNWLPDHMRV